MENESAIVLVFAASSDYVYSLYTWRIARLGINYSTKRSKLLRLKPMTRTKAVANHVRAQTRLKSDNETGFSRERNTRDTRIRIQLRGMKTSRTLGPINGKTNFYAAAKSVFTELPRIFSSFCPRKSRREPRSPLASILYVIYIHIYVYIYIFFFSPHSVPSTGGVPVPIQRAVIRAAARSFR